MSTPRGRRWSDSERNLGPFTYAPHSNRWHFTLSLSSGDDEYPFTRLHLTILGHTLITFLPRILQPHRVKVVPNWDAATVARLGRDYYFDETERSYGVHYHDGLLNVPYGRQSHDSSTEQRWAWFLPWTQWRHVRRSWYGVSGEHYATILDRDGRSFEQSQSLSATQPKRLFVFADYDGEVIEATTSIEEREWRFGEGAFRWLSLFRRAKVRRSLDINFSAEVGKEKGSWKGGIMGHSIDMLPYELHAAAFERYCEEHGLTLIEQGATAGAI